MAKAALEFSHELILQWCRYFLSIQQQLIEAWKSENTQAIDFEFLVDFKNATEVHAADQKWTGKKHGLGVRFESDLGIVVDVPFGVSTPTGLDPNRLFDFLRSMESRIHPTIGALKRQHLYDAFDSMEKSGEIFAVRNGNTLYFLN